MSAGVADATIVGSWTATIYRSDGVIEQDVRYTFTADGRVTQVGPQGTGTGTWAPTSPVSVAFDTRTETAFGYLLVHQDVVLIGDRFFGAGTGAGYDFAGNLLAATDSAIDATRT